jgi:hypothetical protein
MELWARKRMAVAAIHWEIGIFPSLESKLAIPERYLSPHGGFSENSVSHLFRRGKFPVTTTFSPVQSLKDWEKHRVLLPDSRTCGAG